MKLNWGSGIAFAYLAFALGMVGVVFASRQHDPGLVQKDYYDLDLNYQDRLERKQNTAGLNRPPQVMYAATDKKVAVRFPDGMDAAAGTAKFYRSATTKDDFSVKFENGQPLSVSAENMFPGRWHVEMEWEVSGTKYFWESAFFVAG